MLYWIFDLDHTLYQMPDGKKFDYSLLDKNNNISNLINQMPSKKIIFTNASYNHVYICLNILKINNMDKIITRDDIQTLKPLCKAFTRFLNQTEIKSTDKCIFFEDSINNLIRAKTYGWITVLISKEPVNSPFVDFCFPNIEIGLTYFINLINNRISNTN
jgi:FMN phosphatase YigB (HAD superfamily)